MERRKIGIDLLKLSLDQAADLKEKSGHEIILMTKYRYMSWDDVSEKYYQTSDYKEEGLTLVKYDKFLEVNNI